MKATQFRGMPVVSVAAAEKIGVVHDLVLRPDQERVVGVRIKLLAEGIIKTVPTEVVTVGRDAVTVRDTTSLPEEQLTEVGGTVDLSKLLGTKVLSHGGDVLGKVEEVEVDPSDLKLIAYTVGSGPVAALFGGKKTLTRVEGIHYGKGILMVPDDAVDEGGQTRAA